MRINPKILWPLGILAILFIAIYAVGPSFKKSVETALVDKIVTGFSDETAQTRFMSYATMVTPLKRVELAKINQVEIFERSSQPQLFWKRLNLPEVVVRVTVPVEYRYYVDLNQEWKIELNEQTLTVTAPALFAGTPSPDISKLNFEVRKGSIFRNEAKVEAALQSELTGLLEKRAKDSTVLVRETARQQISSLAEQWLKSETKQAQINVRFADELDSVP